MFFVTVNNSTRLFLNVNPKTRFLEVQQIPKATEKTEKKLNDLVIKNIDIFSY